MNNTQFSGLIPEWARQCATMLVWPHKDTDWNSNSNGLLDDITNTYLSLCNTIQQYQPVIIICKENAHEQEIRNRFAQFNQKRPPIYPALYIQAPYNDTWCRDYGPLSIMETSSGEARLALLDFRFNGWGEKYASLNDDRMCERLSQKNIFAHPTNRINFALEGGSIESNGEGLLLTTEMCLLSGTRNKGLTRRAIEKELSLHLQCKKVLWLTKGSIIGDDTDGHVDNLARFTNPNTIVYASCTDSDDVHYDQLITMEEELREQNNKYNLNLTLVPVPIPSVLKDIETNDRLPGSYINFVMVNDAVIIPTFGVPQDDIALDIFASLFPSKDIQPIDGTQLIRQFGGPHCATMQLPEHSLRLDFLANSKSSTRNNYE